jgi:hypothetical protein
MPAMYSMAFTPGTMARITRLVEAAPIFVKYYTFAMGYSVNLVKREAIARAPVGSRPGYSGGRGSGVGGHGHLRGGINGYVHSPWHGEVGVISAVPYGQRREKGFSGMTDSLGRYYANDPGSFYLRNALHASEPGIAAAFHQAARMAFREIAL